MVIFKENNENPLIELYDLNQIRQIDKREEIRVQNLVRNYLKKIIKIPQSLNKLKTIRVCNNLYQHLYDILFEKVSLHNIRLLIYTLKQLELTEASKIRISRDLEQRKSRYNEKNYYRQRKKIYAWYNETAAGLRLLISIILQSRMLGRNKLKTRTWSFIFSLIKEMNQLSTISDYNYYGLADYRFLINNDFQYSLQGEEIFNLDHYVLVFGKKFHDISRYDYKEKLEIKPFIEEFKIVSKAYYTQYGFNPEELVRLLGSLWRMSYFSAESMQDNRIFIDYEKLKRKPDFPIFKFPKEELYNLLMNSRVQKINQRQIIPIITFLKLEPEDYAEYTPNSLIIPSNLIKNQKRISLNPIIFYNDYFIFGNECCHIAALNWMTYLKTGTFPLKKEKNNVISNALKQFHRIKDKKLEEEASEIACNVVGTQYVESNINNFKRLSTSFEKRPKCGEIDLLVVNPKIRILFIIEIKNLRINIIPGDNKNVMKKFYGLPLDKKSTDKSYYNHLNLKCKFIENNFEIVLNHFLIPDSSKWSISSAFLLPEYIVSVFKKGIKVNFVRKNDLASFINGK